MATKKPGGGGVSSERERVREDPRLAQTREIVLSASLELLLKEGLRRVTVARVHKLTGVARTTIYRHWPTQTDLILATLDRLTMPGFSFDATDDFEADLRELLTRLKARMERREVREMVSATMAMAMQGPDHHPVARRFLDGMLEQIRERIQMEADNLDLDPAEVERLYDRVVGPLLFRHVMMIGTIDPEQITEVAANAARWLNER